MEQNYLPDKIMLNNENVATLSLSHTSGGIWILDKAWVTVSLRENPVRVLHAGVLIL